MGYRDTMRQGAAAFLRPLWPGETVLLIEEHPSVLKFTAHLLKMQGLSVLEAHSEDEAYEVSSLHPGSLQLLLADIRLKQVSGPDIASRITAQRPETQIAWCSRRSWRDLIEDGLLGPGEAYFSKPFDISSFRALVSGRAARGVSWTPRP